MAIFELIITIIQTIIMELSDIIWWLAFIIGGGAPA